MELYDKACQTDLGGTAALGAGRVEEDGNAIGAQSTSLLKKTPDKRRNHLRYLMVNHDIMCSFNPIAHGDGVR